MKVLGKILSLAMLMVATFAAITFASSDSGSPILDEAVLPAECVAGEPGCYKSQLATKWRNK